jgi:hypothetical protein
MHVPRGYMHVATPLVGLYYMHVVHGQIDLWSRTGWHNLHPGCIGTLAALLISFRGAAPVQRRLVFFVLPRRRFSLPEFAEHSAAKGYLAHDQSAPPLDWSLPAPPPFCLILRMASRAASVRILGSA